MNAQRILSVMQTLTTLESKVADSEDTIQSLLLKLETLEKANHALQESLSNIFKKTLCPTCSHYLVSKRDGDTVEGHPCANVFLQRCPGIAQ